MQESFASNRDNAGAVLPHSGQGEITPY